MYIYIYIYIYLLLLLLLLCLYYHYYHCYMYIQGSRDRTCGLADSSPGSGAVDDTVSFQKHIQKHK